jgi:Fic family protein
MLIDQQLAGGLTSEQDSLPSPAQRESFIISALREEAIASSMLEGAITTRREAREMLSTGRRPHNRGEQMVFNNYQAIQFIRENGKADLSPEFLQELQKILTDKTLDDPNQVGRFRTADDVVHIVDERDGEIMHRPPPASEIQERLTALCAFANRPTSEKEFVHPVISACVLHFQLGFDHPFCDGNGRTARAVFYWMMLRSGYWLFEFLPISRLIYRAPARYARAFLYCETDNFDITYFLMYKARIIELARHDLRKYIASQQQQMAQARNLFSADSRLNHRQRELVLAVTRGPDRYFTVAEHQNRQGISYATARKDLLQLAEWNYIKMVSVAKRFEFIAGEKLSDLK